jgi:hypothetical protein
MQSGSYIYLIDQRFISLIPVPQLQIFAFGRCLLTVLHSLSHLAQPFPFQGLWVAALDSVPIEIERFGEVRFIRKESRRSQ